jgi:nucleotide-binding universal stress UspA family protein
MEEPAMPTTIVVPLDATDLSATALGPAHDLAVALGAPLVLFRACWTDADEARRELEALADKHDGIPTSVLVTHGFAAPGIANAIAEHPGAVVCMATTGHAGAKALVLGGVADEVLRTTSCPLVLVGPDCSPVALTKPGEGAALVLCFDGSEAAEEAVPLAVEWARALHLEVHVVAVTNHDGDRVGDHAAAPVRTRAHEIVDALAADGVAARAAFPNHHDPARGIVHYADEQPTALIATAAHRRDGLGHGVLGPAALRIVRHATVPVLVAERRS